jgi:two-component system alkaline phosphatase synthesis response regulator PhoP
MMKKILIADDEEFIRELIAATINRGDYELVEAKDGIEALDLARKEMPDLIVLDIKMPGIDGFKVCKELKSEPETASIKIIVLTAFGQDEDIRKGKEAGADDYFLKPFNPIDLMNKIDGMLR